MKNSTTNPILRIRKEKGLSASQFGLIAGVSFSRISQIEMGEPKQLPKSVLKAVEILGYNPDQIQREYIEWRQAKIQEILEWASARS